MAQGYRLQWSDSRGQAHPRSFGSVDEALNLARAMARISRKGLDVVDHRGATVRTIRFGERGEFIESGMEAAAVATG